MKSTIKKRTWKAIYRLLDRVSPVDGDCGRLCGSVCCTWGCNENPDNNTGTEIEMGIYLYPGEHKIHDKKDSWLKWSVEYAENYEFPPSWKGPVYFVKCTTPPLCPRERRPFQCRTFPLYPYISEDGIFSLVYNYENLPYTCPLIDNETPLNRDFVKATYTVWTHLLRDPLIYDLVESDSRRLDEKSL